MVEPGVFPMAARELGVRFGPFSALVNVSLGVAEGDRLAVLGANGSGKSVLLRTLHGLITPSTGTLTWNGTAVRPPSQAMVFQRPVMLRRTALANITYGLAVQGARVAERAMLAQRALERVGLGALAHRQARVLSVGEQQRIALARAWALEPRLLFLDEPTASLDPSAAAEVERIMGEMHRAGTTIVFSTHNLGFARRFADRIAFLDRGRLVEIAASEDFFLRPASVEAARYLHGELPWINTSPVSSTA
jgi:tungstate transport system ATP-binding protein